MNHRELAICKRRGHDRSGREEWRRCRLEVSKDRIVTNRHTQAIHQLFRGPAT